MSNDIRTWSDSRGGPLVCDKMYLHGLGYSNSKLWNLISSLQLLLNRSLIYSTVHVCRECVTDKPTEHVRRFDESWNPSWRNLKRIANTHLYWSRTAGTTCAAYLSKRLCLIVSGSSAAAAESVLVLLIARSR